MMMCLVKETTHNIKGNLLGQQGSCLVIVGIELLGGGGGGEGEGGFKAFTTRLTFIHKRHVLEINFIDLKFRFDNTRRQNTTS